MYLRCDFSRFKSDPQRAYETLKKYQEFRKNDKALFARMRPNAMKHLFDSKVITKLPGNDVEGRPVILMNFKFWDVKLYSAEDLVLLTMMFLEELIRTQVSSVTVILDWEGYGLANFRQYTYRNIMRTLALAKGSFPISFKGIHQINENRVFWLVSKVVFAFFSAKLKKRMQVHGTNRESLAAYIPFSSLPADYGGWISHDTRCSR
ncbi:Alpha-tocopherol transfer protein-like [Orchesella cincta]|uniref:Alpha-tocopherol transfer protein-like n=1 Tax=Orchesella cincta TaxID=48709 RepID=A0A1D2M423_ORCCI|nr:Alpha-tocopherol transfer protein-like [Orchesella cincta]